MKRDRYCYVLAGISVLLAPACVIAAVIEGNTNTFDRIFAVHSILMWLWMVDTAAVIFLSRFSWFYFLLLILAPLAIAPIPAWMFILFRVFKVPFAP
ncbi:MAG: hypothetical protein DME49_12080 [Verrucomicrobia bacterium]|nr:MAG: hypothetical protein DME49_12080 [Verrucomicrobiota bacterium]